MDDFNLSRKETIYSKGFNMADGYKEYKTSDNEFKKIKVGLQTLQDATLSLGSYTDKKNNIRIPYGDKTVLLRAIMENDYRSLREFSKFFYKTNGIYTKLCQYTAFMYRYDWYVKPQILDENLKEEKILKEFYKVLNFLDNSYIKKICGEMALKIIVEGSYYGYLVESDDSIVIQELPINYCRTRYSIKGMPVIEFNMSYFDTFKDTQYRMKVLNLFPDEFKKGYVLYKQNKLQSETFGDGIGWFVLTPGLAFKFNLNGSDIPAFINVIPSLIDLDAAQDLDRRKQLQKLLKIIIQKLPLDKNGELIFDVDEARDIHNNAVEMLKRAIGVDVLTTFADVESIDMSDKNTTTTKDDLAKVERTVYNSAGISKNIFNTDGNLALEKSILQDESTIRNILLQFTIFFNQTINKFNTNKKRYSFQFYMLETTQYNYQALSKLYKEQVQSGYSKLLPQIALGHSQSFILDAAYFENNVLHLTELMMPNLMSSTMNLQDLQAKVDQTNQSNNQNNTEQGEPGRPEKPDDEKSEKTIQNRESMS